MNPSQQREKRGLPHFLLTLERDPALPFSLTIIVTRGIRRAVERNRVKRVIREFFRKNSGLLPWSGVVCRVHPAAGKIKNAILFQELGQLL